MPMILRHRPIDPWPPHEAGYRPGDNERDRVGAPMVRQPLLERIVECRRARIARDGYVMGASVPARRTLPLTSFLQAPALICEIKRRSPSRGVLADGLDPTAQAETYCALGARNLSVLTEMDHFGGSLNDLVAIKRHCPQAAVLRKDFLLDKEDVIMSWRAGADAILLIAAILQPDRLCAMLGWAAELGMQALVEVHSIEEIAAVSACRPPIIGINSRNLSDFSLDPLLPLRLRPAIDWPCQIVYESGIFEAEQARVAGRGGFHALLVGEAVMKQPRRIPQLIDALNASNASNALNASNAQCLQRPECSNASNALNASDASNASEALMRAPPTPRAGFWNTVARRLDRRPLVKICGITNRDDAVMAVAAGADMLGFVYAPSPRRASDNLPTLLRDLPVLKVAVVLADGGLPEPVGALLHDGAIDAVQFHGNEAPNACADMAFPYYKAGRIRDARDIEPLRNYRCPRVLIDAFDAHRAGGTGTRIADHLVEAARKVGPLWLAGGISPDNVAEIITHFDPELIDVSSKLERHPGRKDAALVERLFVQIAAARPIQPANGYS